MTRVTVANTNLFAVAAAYLRDATQWVRIAELNGLADSTVTTTTTLVLPGIDPTATGGVVAIDALARAPVRPVDIFAPRATAAGALRNAANATWDGFTWDDGSMWH